MAGGGGLGARREFFRSYRPWGCRKSKTSGQVRSTKTANRQDYKENQPLIFAQVSLSWTVLLKTRVDSFES